MIKWFNYVFVLLLAVLLMFMAGLNTNNSLGKAFKTGLTETEKLLNPEKTETTIQKAQFPTIESPSQSTTSPPSETQTTDRSIAIVVFKFQNEEDENPFSMDQDLVPVRIREIMFGEASFPPPKYVKDYFIENSNGALEISGEVFGVHTIPIRNDDPNKDYGEWGIEALQEEPEDLAGFDHIIFMFPKPPTANGFDTDSDWSIWSGKTETGTPDVSYIAMDKDMWLFPENTKFIPILAHHVGHGLNLDHASLIACEDSYEDYANCNRIGFGDRYNIMGHPLVINNFYNDDLLPHLNGAQKEFLGWIDSEVEEISATDGLSTHFIRSIESGYRSTKVLKIQKPDTTDYYYVEFRQDIGYDEALPSGIRNSLLVFIKGVFSPQTFLVDVNPNGSSFSNDEALTYDPINPKSFIDSSNGLEITFKEMPYYNAARVTVEFDEDLKTSADIDFPSDSSSIIIPDTETEVKGSSSTSSNRNIQRVEYQKNNDPVQTASGTTSWQTPDIQIDNYPAQNIITATAVDSQGATGSDSIAINRIAGIANTTFFAFFNDTVNAQHALGNGLPAESTGIDEDNFEPVKLGNGVRIGVLDRLSYEVSNNINLDQGAIEFWIKPNWDGDDPNSYTLFDMKPQDSSTDFTIRKCGIGKCDPNFSGLSAWTTRFWCDFFRCYTGKYAILNANIEDWKAGELHHVAITYDSNSRKLYLDGVLRDTDTGNWHGPLVGTDSNPLPETFSIGHRGLGWEKANAVIDHLRIWDVKINDLQVAESADSVNPILTVFNPPSKTFTSTGPNITLNGTISDNLGTLKQAIAVTDSGDFVATGTSSWQTPSIPLHEGVNTIDIIGVDETENTFVDTYTINYADFIEPTLSISSPSTDTFETTNPNLTINGTSSDNPGGGGVTQVSWSNNRGGNGVANGTANWSFSVSLSPGTNIISIGAIDAFGNYDLGERIINYDIPDNESPQISIENPSSSNQVLPNNFSFRGSASDNFWIEKVEWTNNSNGTNGTTTGTDNWIAQGIPLQQGINSITFTAFDLQNNTKSETIIVRGDSTQPTISLNIPTSLSNFTTASSPITISGTTSDNFGVSKVIWQNNNGGSGKANGFSSWRTSNVNLFPGLNTINVYSVDRANNLSSIETIDVTLIDTLPQDSDTSFAAHYDYSVIADYSENEFIVPHFDSTIETIDIVQGKITKGIAVDEQDELYYYSGGTVDLGEGTLEFWVSPNWESDDTKDHVFFNLAGANQGAGHQFNIGKVYQLPIFVQQQTIYFTGLAAWTFFGDKQGIVLADISDWQKGEWHHIATSWGPSGRTLHVDGKLIDSENYFGPLVNSEWPNQKFGLGVSSFTLGTKQADSKFDEFRISKRQRTANEIALIANSGKSFNASFDSGFNADYSKGSQTATQSGIDLVSGIENQAIKVDAASDVLNYSGIDNFDPDLGTISFWLKPQFDPATDPNVRMFLDVEFAEANNYFNIYRWVGQQGGYIVFNMGNSASSGAVCDGTWWQINSADNAAEKQEPYVTQVWDTDSWHYVTVTWNNTGPSEESLYLDGELIQKRTRTTACNLGTPQTIKIGNNIAGDRPMNSTIDKLQILNVQKSQPEIFQEYIEGLTLIGQYCVYGETARPTNTCISEGLLPFYCNSVAEVVSNCNICQGCSGEFRCGANGACYRPPPKFPVTEEI